jgi:hypothetical protein
MWVCLEMGDIHQWLFNSYLIGNMIMKTSELMGIAYFETSPMSVCMKIGARRVIPNPVSYPDRRTVAGDGLLSQAE